MRDFMNRLLHSRTFLRYLGSYIIVLFTMFAGVSVYMFRYFDRTMENGFVESEINLLTHLKNSHEYNLNSMFNMAEQFSVSKAVVPFRFIERPEKVRPLIEHLSSYRSVNTFSSEQFLMFYMDDYLYSGKTSIHYERFFEKGVIYQNVSPQELELTLYSLNGITVIGSQPVSGILMFPEREAVTFILPLSAGKSGAMMFIVDTRQYADMMRQHIRDIRNTYILYKGSVIVKECSVNLPDALIENSIFENAYSGDKIRYEDKTYMMVTLNGKNDMTYCSLVEMSAVTESLSRQQRSIWFFFLWLILASIVLIVLLSIYNYKPVDTLRSLLTGKNVRDEFSAIQTGINDLVGQNKELSSLLAESMEFEQYNIIIKFIKGRYTCREDFLRNTERLKTDMDKTYYIIALSDLEDTVPIEKLRVKSIRTGDVNGCGVELVFQHQMMYALFSNDRDKLMEYVRGLHKTNREQNIRATLSVSGIHMDVLQGATAYLEAITAFDNRFLLSNESVLCFDDVQLSSSSFVYPDALINRLKSALHSSDLIIVDAAIDEILNHVRTLKPSLFTFRFFYNDIIRTVIYEQGITDDKLNKLKDCDVFTLSGCRSIQELNDMLRNICHGLFCDDTAAPRIDDSMIQQVIQQAEAYMLSNYANPEMSMMFLAEYFSMSIASFSKEFKKHTGLSPSEYLMQVRIDQAKKLLSATDISVKSISIKIGYYDVSGFIRRFRRHTGMTPTMYRHWVAEEMKK